MRTRAKFRITNVERSGIITQIEATAVSEQPFNPDGVSEDNDFARWTPSGELKMTVTNPTLLDVFKAGQKYYLDFTEAAD